jgi:hypothetical protein
MQLTKLITQWLVTDRVAEMSERVAGRSRMGSWQRVIGQVDRLSLPELRGYIRARIGTVVQDETDRLIEQEGPKVGKLRAQIIDQAMASLIETLASQILQQHTAQQRQVAQPRRLAA